jgi:mediator of RNA polymerase II transcription subunit 31
MESHAMDVVDSASAEAKDGMTAAVRSPGSDMVPWPEGSERFLIDLEFVQNLCSLQYLNYLAQNKYLDDAAFLNYLQYLRYWKDPKYMPFLMFPQCLDFLEALIVSPRFRKELNIPQFVAYCHEQQGLQWLHDYSTNCT